MNKPTQPDKKSMEKGLPKYSIKGGICNASKCLRICTGKSIIDGIWYCDIHVKEKVAKFIDLVPRVV